jgi:hypothetical protein
MSWEARNKVMVVFDEGTEWSGGLVFFWARRGEERIRCVAGRDAIAGLPGFAMATVHQIEVGKDAIKELLKPHVLNKLERNEFEDSKVPMIRITVHDLGRYQRPKN